MQFVIIGEDKAGALENRQKTRPDHLDYWKSRGQLFLAAGPFLDEQDQPVGSMIVIEAASLEEAQKLADADPYMVAGVFETLSVKRWNWIFGNPNSSEGN